MVDNKRIILSTPELMDFRKVREAVADKLTRLIPLIKTPEWNRILHPLMEKAIVIDAPDDASSAGIVRARLGEFIQRADLDVSGEDREAREALQLGQPVVQIREQERVVYFRGPDFVQHLKKTRSEELRGTNLWMALKEAGVESCRLRVGEGKHSPIVAVWYVPLDETNQPTFKTASIPDAF